MTQKTRAWWISSAAALTLAVAVAVAFFAGAGRASAERLHDEYLRAVDSAAYEVDYSRSELTATQRSAASVDALPGDLQTRVTQASRDLTEAMTKAEDASSDPSNSCMTAWPEQESAQQECVAAAQGVLDDISSRHQDLSELRSSQLEPSVTVLLSALALERAQGWLAKQPADAPRVNDVRGLVDDVSTSLHGVDPNTVAAARNESELTQALAALRDESESSSPESDDPETNEPMDSTEPSTSTDPSSSTESGSSSEDPQLKELQAAVHDLDEIMDSIVGPRPDKSKDPSATPTPNSSPSAGEDRGQGSTEDSSSGSSQHDSDSKQTHSPESEAPDDHSSTADDHGSDDSSHSEDPGHSSSSEPESESEHESESESEHESEPEHEGQPTPHETPEGPDDSSDSGR